MNWTVFAVVCLVTVLTAALGAAVAVWLLGRARRLERERVAHEGAVVNFREGTAHNLLQIHGMTQQVIRATQQLVEQREPTQPEVVAYLQKRNLWMGTAGDMIAALTGHGYVVVTDKRWAEIVARLGPMTKQEWTDRED